MPKSSEVDFRIAVGASDGPRSSVWRGFSTKNEVYLSHSGMGGIEKFSFHSSQICRLAFTEHEDPAEGEADRVTQKWNRAPTPLSGGISYALVAKFPTDLLSTALEPERKKVNWIPAASSGAARVLEFIFSRYDERAATKFAQSAGRAVVSYTLLPNGDAFVVASTQENWSRENFTVPGALHPDHEYVISTDDPDKTGRPARFTWYIDPSDGHPMIAEEFGAYPVPLGTKFSQPMGKLTRTKVLKRSNKS